MNSPAACFNYFSPAQCFLSPPRPALHARLSRFSLDCVFSINRTGDRIFMGESAQEKFSSYRLVAHVFRYLRQKFGSWRDPGRYCLGGMITSYSADLLGASTLVGG